LGLLERYVHPNAPKAGGPESLFDGKFLTVFKRQPDGSWKIYRDCFNSNVPPK
jgi:ketosteroid isomerase-like protein